MVALLLAVGYLLGSLPFAVLVSRGLRYPDPRTYGSGNPGATNVLRGGGRVAAALTLLGDASKGALAVWLGRYAGGETLAAACGAAAFVGHVFPLFLRLKGGKGVATFLGVAFALQVWVGLGCSLVWLAAAVLSRLSSLASLCAAASAPLLLTLAGGGDSQLLLVVAMAALLFWRHRENIARLRAGTEARIGAPTSESKPQREDEAAQSQERGQ